MSIKKRIGKLEIAELSNVSTGKVKNYIKLFSEYFQAYRVDGSRHPAYDSDAISIVKVISEMMPSRNHDDIRRALQDAGHYPIVDVLQEPQGSSRDMVEDKHIAVSEQLPSEMNLQAITKTMDALYQIVEIQAGLLEAQKRLLGEQKQVIEDLRSQN